MSLTRFSKVLISLAVVGAMAAAVQTNYGFDRLLPEPQTEKSNVPQKIDLPESSADLSDKNLPGCSSLPEVRLLHWAWNAQLGMMFANGGKQSVAGSLMCDRSVNLRLV